MGGLVAAAQEPLTLRQAVNQALEQNPKTPIARANNQEAKSSAAIARTQLMPQLNFTEDISAVTIRYMLRSPSRQRQFTQADFALNSQPSSAHREFLLTLLRLVDGV